MKKVLLGLGAAACVFGFTGSAFAVGQGGVAGSASFQLAAGAVTSASAAVSVGKTTAYAGAATTAAGATEAFAVGAGGDLAFGAGTIYLTGVTADISLGTAQLNDLSGSSTNVNVTAGTVGQTNP